MREAAAQIGQYRGKTFVHILNEGYREFVSFVADQVIGQKGEIVYLSNAEFEEAVKNREILEVALLFPPDKAGMQ